MTENPFAKCEFLSPAENLKTLDVIGTVLSKYKGANMPIPGFMMEMVIQAIMDCRLYSTKRDWEHHVNNLDPMTADLVREVNDQLANNN